MRACNKKLVLQVVLAAAISFLLAGKLTAQTFTILRSFNPQADGAKPFGNLILSGSTLYGTTGGGGAGNNGTVFAVSTDGTDFTVLHSFNGTDGSFCRAGLILAGNTLYGTASNGGSSNNGTVFALNTVGTYFTNLYNFSGGNDGAQPSGGLVLASNTLYGTTQLGGSSGNGTVFALKADATAFATLHSFSGEDGASSIDGLVWQITFSMGRRITAAALAMEQCLR